MSTVSYDITTAGQLAVLQYVIKRIDIRLGYLAGDGVTPTPKQGRDGWQVGGAHLPVSVIGQTTKWTELRPHPTTSGRYLLLVDEIVADVIPKEIAALQALVNAGTATAGQTTLLNGLNALPAPVVLDPSWSTIP